MKAHFNGHITYDVVCKAEVCNPVRGMVFKVSVKNKNELGILAEGNVVMDGAQMPVMDVLIPRRSAGITSDIDLDAVNTGDEVFVEVLGKRYQLLDKKISIIARAIKEPQKKRQKESEKAIQDYEEGGGLQEDFYGDGGSSDEEAASDGGSEDEGSDEGTEEGDESDGGDAFGGDSDLDDLGGGDDPVGGGIIGDEDF